jgi:hypothetical protein
MTTIPRAAKNEGKNHPERYYDTGRTPNRLCSYCHVRKNRNQIKHIADRPVNFEKAKKATEATSDPRKTQEPRKGPKQETQIERAAQRRANSQKEGRPNETDGEKTSHAYFSPHNMEILQPNITTDVKTKTGGPIT